MNDSSKRYRVVTIPKTPFVIYEEDKNAYSGMLIDILNEAARRLNFTYEIYAESDGQYGYISADGNWNGMMRELKERRADIGLGAVSVMSERMKVVDFTEPIFTAGISVLMQKPIAQTSLFRFLTVLESDVWLCIVGAYLFTSLLLWAFDTWSPYSYQNSKEKYKHDAEQRIFTLKESLWFCLSSLTPQGGGEAPKNLSGRLVAATWWLFGFIIIASYTANLAAFLTISKIEKNIETFGDLISQYKYTYTVIENSSTYRYFQRMNDIEQKCFEFRNFFFSLYTLCFIVEINFGMVFLFRMWKDMALNDSLRPYERAQLAVWEYPLSDKYIKIFSAINHHAMVKNLSEGLEKLQAPDSKFTLITEASDVKYQAMINCNFKEIGPEFSKKPYAIALQKNSPLTKQLNDVLNNMTRENLFKKIKDKWWKSNQKEEECYDADDANGISIYNIGGVFVLIAVGIIVAILTLIYEYFYYKYFRQKFEKFFRNLKKLKIFQQSSQNC